MSPVCSCKYLMSLIVIDSNLDYWSCKKCSETYFYVYHTNLLDYQITLPYINNVAFRLIGNFDTNVSFLEKIIRNQDKRIISRTNFISLPFQEYLMHTHSIINRILNLKAFL